MAIEVPTTGRHTERLDSNALVGMDGNAFAIIGNVRGMLRRAGASKEFLAAFMAEAMSGDYDHVLQTAMAYLDAEPGTEPCICGEYIDQHTGRYLVCPDGIHEFEPRTDANYDSRGRCAACGSPLTGDLAETARGIIHADCIDPDEALA